MHALAVAPAPSPSPAERRVHARTLYNGILQIQIPRDPTWYPVYGEDVSSGGFAFFSEIEMCRGESISVAAGELDGVTVAASVRHVQRRGRGWFVGVEFDDPLPRELAWRFGC